MNYFTIAGFLCALIFLGVNDTQAGEIVRSREVLRQFQKLHPCPATGKRTGACPGYVKDHKRPLCAGGTDTVDNLQWQTKEAGLQKDELEWWVCRHWMK